MQRLTLTRRACSTPFCVELIRLDELTSRTSTTSYDGGRSTDLPQQVTGRLTSQLQKLYVALNLITYGFKTIVT